MDQFSFLRQTKYYRNRRVIYIIAGSVLGYLAGGAPAEISPVIVSLMRSAVYTPVSIVWLFAVLCFPLLLSACAVIYHFSASLPIIAFCKSAAFSICTASIHAVFGSAGWLIRSMLMFSSVWNLPVLFYFWFRHADGEEASLWHDLKICICLQALIAITDVALIAPLLRKITF